MRNNYAVVSLCLVLLASCSPAQEGRPQLELDGTGRVCAGHISVTRTKVTWKTPLTSCESSYKVLRHQGTDWTLQTETSASCGSIKSITIHKTDPSDTQSFWNISGFANLPASKDDATQQPALSCLMY